MLKNFALDKLITNLSNILHEVGEKVIVRHLHTTEVLNVSTKIKASKIITSEYDINEFHAEFGRTEKQLTSITNQLKKDKYTRQAIANNWKATGLFPCNVILQFIYRKKQLHLISYLRSSDINRLKNDILSLTYILNTVSKTLNFKTGYIYLYMASLHQYE